jgi:hypothetical protein
MFPPLAEVPRHAALGLVALAILVTTDRRSSPCHQAAVIAPPPAASCERYVDVGSNFPVLVCESGASYMCTKDRDLHAPPCESYVRAHPWFRAAL